MPAAAGEVMQLLKTRRAQMVFGTSRMVQFVDSAASEMAIDSSSEAASRKSDLMAKIDAVGALSSVHNGLTPEKP